MITCRVDGRQSDRQGGREWTRGPVTETVTRFVRWKWILARRCTRRMHLTSYFEISSTITSLLQLAFVARAEKRASTLPAGHQQQQAISFLFKFLQNPPCLPGNTCG